MNFEQIIPRTGTSCLKWDSDTRYGDDNVLPMWVADMDFPTAVPISHALECRAAHPIYGYTYDGGDFQRITRDWISRRHGWNIEPEWVAFSPSVLTSLAIFLNIAVQPGQSVIIMPPVYYPFSQFILNNGRRVEVCPLLYKDGCYQIDFAKLRESASKDSSAALILCNPHNPAGRVFRREELTQIADICCENRLKVFADEIHSDLIMPGFEHIPFASISKEISELTVTAYSPSKTFNLAGLQASSTVISNPVMRVEFLHCRAAWGIENINCFALEGYRTAYTAGDAYLEELCQYLAGNRDYVETFIREKIPELSVSPLEGTYLMWLNCSALAVSPEDLETFFWEKAKLSLDGGTWFGTGGEGFMRLNIACPRTTLETAMSRLDYAIHSLKEG